MMVFLVLLCLILLLTVVGYLMLKLSVCPKALITHRVLCDDLNSVALPCFDRHATVY